MGSRVQREAVKDLEKKKKRAAQDESLHIRKAKSHAAGPIASGVGSQHADILQATANMEGLTYMPRTQETREAYELILSITATALGDQSGDVVRSAADTIIQTLKDSEMKDLDKKKEIESIIDTISSETFSQLINLSKRLTDYEEEVLKADGEDPDAGRRALGDEEGVAVMFDNEDEDSESNEETYVVREDSDDEEEADDSGAQVGNDMDETRADAEREKDDNLEIGAVAKKQQSGSLSARDIDAYWLQRLIGKHYTDELEAAQKANEALQIIATSTDVRESENRLMEHFDYEHFETVELMVKNQELILWCTRLAKASEDDKVNLEVEMREKGLGWILRQLRGGQNTEGGAGRGLVPMDLDEKAKERARRITTKATLAPGTTAQPRKAIDLEAMAFAQGGHLNTNNKVRLPEGSFKRSKKGYEEIHVPAPVKRSIPDSERVPISSLPQWAQEAFPGATSLNAVQSKCYPVAFGEDEPMLLCAPTGAGKTNVAMLTILHELEKWRDERSGQFDLSSFKIVYVAPMKALVAEQAANFRDRLAVFGVTVNELTGDNQLTKEQIAETQIIVTTPEKWDVVSRKNSDSSYTNLVRLMIIDEIHLLHDDRGPVLESIVARTIRRMEQLNDPVRLVGLSATLPNYKDVATFLRVNPKKGLFYFEAAYRPCPLQQQFIGITEKKAIKRFQLMNEITYEKTLEQAGKNQVLIFTHSRKETAKTAKFIRDQAMENDVLSQFLPQSSASREVLQAELENVKDANLRDVLPYGFGIHHAGMTRADRQLVEDLFGDGHLQVLVSTATLAWGVNLPAHTVIIKGTQVYNPEKGRWTELSSQDMLQMLGRAGRPQYDSFGEGVIITNHSELQYYLSLMNQQLPIESQFVSKLADNLNAEIVLGTVRNRDEAVAWLGYTYLYVRMLRSPSLYGVTADYADEDPFLEQKRSDIVHSAAALLEKCGLLRYDRKTGLFASNDLGKVASHFYITYRSMSTYNQHLRPYLSIVELFRIFALSEEFKFQVVRQDEKLEVAKLLERVPIPVKESLEDPAAKVNVLLQTWISHLSLEGYVLAADMVYVTQSAGRILRALFEICLKRGYARLAHVALDLCKMVDMRQWNSMTPLRQFKGVPADLVRRLERKEYPWNRLRDLEPNEIGELIGVPKAGRLVHRLVNQFPRLDLQAFFQPITASLLSVQLTITPDFQWDERVHGRSQAFHILVEDVDGEIILYHDVFLLKQRFAEEEHQISFTVNMTSPVPPNYYISVVSDRWLQSEVRLPISFLNLILPDKYPPHTPLLSMQQQSLDALAAKDIVSCFDQRISLFNKIQTQAFRTLFETDDSAFIGAPTGSGKTICAEIAMLRFWSQAPRQDDLDRIVCLLPYESMLAPRVAQWTATYGSFRGGKQIVALTGESSADLRLLEVGDVIVATPSQWDVLSRRWRQRKNVQRIGLYIADDAQLLGDWKVGSTYEIVLSRARFIAAQTSRQTRFVALSVPLGNAKDIGEWLGVSSRNMYNFSPSVRPVPLEVHLQSFSIPHFPSLMVAMAKPAYLSIVERSPDAPVLAFVSSRRQAVATANDLVTYAIADSEHETSDESRFLNIEEEELKPHLERVSDKALREVLQYGVGFYHEGLSRQDARIVQRLHNAGAIQVVVVSKDMAWDCPMHAHLVVLMGCQTYDGREHRYVDYAITDVLQMVGYASLRGAAGNDDVADEEDGAAKCVMLLQANRKEYFKKFLAEGMPVESRLHSFCQDFFNAEIVAKTIDDKQSAVDILTWTLLYRRLMVNPQVYNCQGKDMQHIGDWLSELVENTLNDLEGSKCITIEDEMDVSALNLGMIASFYNVSYVTVDVFNMSLKPKTKLKGLLEIVSSAAEYEDLPIRQHEDAVLNRLYDRLPYKLDRINFLSPFHKAFILLQAHFARLHLPVDLANDQKVVLRSALNLLSACVDVMSSNAQLNAIIAMELSQMVVQAVWDRDSPLKQVPHFTADTIERCHARGIEDNVYALGDALPDLSDAERNDLLQMSNRQMMDVATFVNEYPYVEVVFAFEQTNDLRASDSITLSVTLSQDQDDDDDDDDGQEDGASDKHVLAPFYPMSKKFCNWWAVIGDGASRNLLCIKKVVMDASKSKTASFKLEFSLPKGRHEHLKLYVLADAYVGADRELALPALDIAEGEDSDEEDEDEEDEDEDEEMQDA
jgi:pre-mRNA-splicing helicase BRR2